MAVKPIPDGYQTVTPYLTVADAEAQINFLKKAFGADETFRHTDDKGKVGHAEVRLGTSMVMIGQARDQWTPKQLASTYMSKTWTRSTSVPSRLARSRCENLRMRRMAIAAAVSRIRRGINGGLLLTLRTCRRRKSNVAIARWGRRNLWSRQEIT